MYVWDRGYEPRPLDEQLYTPEQVLASKGLLSLEHPLWREGTDEPWDDENTDIKPETSKQAQRWDEVKNKYLEVGFCFDCACQSAWGHQLSFAQVRPPCNECEALERPSLRASLHAGPRERLSGSNHPTYSVAGFKMALRAL